jgi:hypothetical protein
VALALLAVTASAASAATVTVIVDGPGTVEASGLSDTKVPFTCVNDGRADRKECTVTYTPVRCPLTGCPEVKLAGVNSVDGFGFAGWKGDCKPAREVCVLPLDGRNAVIAAFFRDNVDPTVGLGAVPALTRGALPLRATAEDNVRVTRVEFNVGGRKIAATADALGFGASVDTTTLSDGTKTVTATAFDAAGNSTTTAPASVTIDNTKPALTVTGPDNQSFPGGSTQRWTLSTSDAHGPPALTCSIVPRGTAADFGDCTSSTSQEISGLPDGAYVLTVHAVDTLSNTAEVKRTFVVDSIAPDTSIESGIADGGVTTDPSLTWTLAASEPGVAFACRVFPAALTPGDFAPCSGGDVHVASGFAPGVYTFEARTTDAAGNVDPTPAKRTFTVDPPPPVVTPPAAAASFAPAVAPPVTAVAGPAPQIVVTLAFNFTSNRTATRLRSLVVKNVPSGSTVAAKCRRGCSAKSVAKKRARGKVSLSKLIRKPLKVGTKITVVISKRGFGSAVKTLTIRARKAPLVGTRCQPEGASRAVACGG